LEGGGLGVKHACTMILYLDHNFIASAIEEIIKYLDIEDTINKDAKSARNAVDRLVYTSLTARSEILRVLSQFEENA